MSNEIKSILKRVHVFDDVERSIKKTNCIAILTEWEIFKKLNWDKISKIVDQPLFIADGRNIIDQKLLNNNNYKYISVGT